MGFEPRIKGWGLGREESISHNVFFDRNFFFCFNLKGSGEE